MTSNFLLGSTINHLTLGVRHELRWCLKLPALNVGKALQVRGYAAEFLGRYSTPFCLPVQPMLPSQRALIIAAKSFFFIQILINDLSYVQAKIV